jgi:hypothetical protein
LNDFQTISGILKNITCSEVGKGGLTIWIGFGDKIKVKDKEKHLYYLVVQCAWRFLQNNKIILASGDMYRCFDETKPFDIGNDFNSVYDEKVTALNMNLSRSVRVTKVNFSDTGDITLLLENDIVFQTFIENSVNDEFWRFISYEDGDSKHIVFHDIECPPRLIEYKFLK